MKSYHILGACAITALLLLILTAVVIIQSRKRRTVGSRYVIALFLSLFLWTGFYMAELLSKGQNLKLAFMKSEYFGMMLVPVFYYFMCRKVFSRPSVRWYEYAAAGVFIALTLVSVWVNPGGAFYVSASLVENAAGHLMISPVYGPLFYIFVVLYLILLVGVSVYIVGHAFKLGRMRLQSILIVISLAVPILTSILYIARVTVFDLTCASFSVTVILMFICFHNYGIFELNMYIKHRLFDLMDEPLFIVDEQGRVALVNPAGEKLLQKKLSECIGRIFLELFPGPYSGDPSLPAYQKTVFFNGREPMELRFRTVKIISRSSLSEEKLIIVNNVTQIHEVEKQLEYLLEYDAVTGLLNGNKFTEALDNYAEKNLSLSGTVLCSGTISNIDSLSGALSKDQKNKLYRSAAEFIQSLAKHPCITARLSENEFCVFSNGLSINIGELIEKLNNNCKVEIELDGESYLIEFRLGVYVVEEGTDTKKALANAAYALRSCMFNFKDSIKVYDKALKLQHTLQKSLAGKEHVPDFKKDFALELQPVIDRKTGKVVGAEAFSRWDHPSLGKIFPNVYVPVLEDVKLINEFGTIIMGKAVSALKTLKGKMGPDFFISINLSKRQIFDVKFAQKIKDMLVAEDIDPKTFILEIKEQHIFADLSNVLMFSDKVRQAGLGMAVDNFGWGNSCFSHILDLNCSMAKLNTTFSLAIQDSKDKAIVVKKMVEMCETLNVRLIAVHIETQKDLMTFEEFGIRYFQGNIFSPAMSLDSLLKFIDSRN